MNWSGIITDVLTVAMSTRAPARNPSVPSANLRMLKRLSDVEFYLNQASIFEDRGGKYRTIGYRSIFRGGRVVMNPYVIDYHYHPLTKNN